MSQTKLALVALLAAPTLAQEAPFAVSIPYALTVPTVHNATAELLLVDQREVHLPGAPALQLVFSDFDLSPGSMLVVSSLTDGHVQVLDGAEIAKWKDRSAHFNGPSLLLELYVAPQGRASYALRTLVRGLEHADDTICFATDDRVPSFDNRATRVLSSGGTSACSGWLGPNNCGFTAGHCSSSYTFTAEFNVPASSASGALQHPAPIDQFPIDHGGVQFVNGGTGNDWGVFTIQPNALGELPYTKFGHYTLGFFTAAVGATTRITGYGTTSLPTTNQIQQTHTGPYMGTNGTSITYQTDTTGGNSGSVVIHEPTGQAIGIHTHGGCGSSGGANSGTTTLNAGFQAAYATKCQPAVPVAQFAASATAVVQGTVVQFSDQSTGGPTTWAWDLDGNGSTDSTLKDPAFVYATPGTYTVSLTVSNALGSDSETKPNHVTVSPVQPVAPPYTQNFQAGLPGGGEWTFTSIGLGAISATGSGTASPGSGSPSLAMASALASTLSTNQAALHLDLSGVQQATLSFWFKEAADEDNPEDGVFLVAGGNLVSVSPFTGANSNWSQRTLDLDALAAQHGVPLDASFTLVFQQRDDNPLGTDGILIDDVAVNVQQMLYGSPSALSVAAGGTQNLQLAAGNSYRFRLYLLLGTTSGTAPGTPLGPVTLPLNADAYTNFTASSPNSALLSSSLAFLDTSGNGSAAFHLPAGAPASLIGLTAHHAYLVFDLKLDQTGTGALLVASNPFPVAFAP
ncbi:MAG: PKD domain-containing protein [Planctomycetota bacterium]|nr:MAG: PKD domain-containing protein [Planctomycetota bacterium]